MENNIDCLEQIQTVAVGAAIGQACLLLAAGMKGRRYMMPHSTGVLSCGPMEWNCVSPSGQRGTSQINDQIKRESCNWS